MQSSHNIIVCAFVSVPLRHIPIAGLTVLAVMLLGYFTYHALEGKRGWHALIQGRADVTATEENLATLRAERQALENRIRRLRDGSIDPDLLDEVAREMLGYSAPNDVVVLTPPTDKK